MSWSPELLRQFRRIAAREGVAKVAEEVPATSMTIYRLIRGETEHPSKAVAAGIERIVRDRESHEETQEA